MDKKTTLFEIIERGKEAYSYLLKDDTFTHEMFSRSGLIHFPKIEDGWRVFDPVKRLLEDWSGDRLSAIYSAIGFRKYRELLLEKITQKIPVDDPEVEYIMEEFCKLSLFSTNFYRLRRFYAPQISSGQDLETEVQLELNGLVAKMIDDQIHKWDDDDYPDDEYDPDADNSIDEEE